MISKRTLFTRFCGVGAVTLALCAAPLFAQNTAPLPSGPGSGAPPPPAYVPEGPTPPANDPVPAPASPEVNAGDATAPPSVTPPGSTAPDKWTTDQILTATVHQAWILSGKNEDTFFQIVKQLAEISAQNRGLVLPDTPEAGRKAGQYIRAQAKADHNALLYAIVDKAVQRTGTPETAAHPAARSAGPPAGAVTR